MMPTMAPWAATTQSRPGCGNEGTRPEIPWIDIDRAAIWGHSGGGFIAADAMFRYPDFFKSAFRSRGTMTSGNMRMTGESDTRACSSETPTARTTMKRRQIRLSPRTERAPAARPRTMDNNVPRTTPSGRRGPDQGEQDFDLLMLPNQAMASEPCPLT